MLLISDYLVVTCSFIMDLKPVKMAIFVIQYFPRFLVNLVLHLVFTLLNYIIIFNYLLVVLDVTKSINVLLIQ